MRDVVAVIVVFVLAAFALSMATSLHWYKRGHSQRRRMLAESGQRIIAEIPGGETLRFFTEDDVAFHWNERSIPKDRIRGARVLISGAPISVYISPHAPDVQASEVRESPDLDSPGGIERDRWDVTIDVDGETVLVECGAIRERVSQDIARQVFEAVRTDIELRDRTRDHHSRSGVL